MSYECFISFREMHQDDVQAFIEQIGKYASMHIDEIAQENCNYVPYIRRKDLKDTSPSMSQSEWGALSEEQRKELFPRDFHNVSQQEIQEATDWAKRLFTLVHYYDAERNLFCAFGIPTVMRNMFDGTTFFQNHCDQDYQRSEYQGVRALEAIWDKWAQKSEADILKYYCQEYGSTLYDDSELSYYEGAEREKRYNEQIAYQRRSGAYAEIWHNYENAIYNNQRESEPLPFDDFNSIVTRLLQTAHAAAVAQREEFAKENDIIYFETVLGMRPKWKAAVERMSRQPMDVKHEMDSFMKLHPDWLQLYPKYQEQYDAFMEEHKDDAPTNHDDVEQDEESK